MKDAGNFFPMLLSNAVRPERPRKASRCSLLWPKACCFLPAEYAAKPSRDMAGLLKSAL